MEELASGSDRNRSKLKQSVGIGKRCIGYGSVEGICEERIGRVALAFNSAGLWCEHCELDRREAIDGQTQKITESFET